MFISARGKLGRALAKKKSKEKGNDVEWELVDLDLGIMEKIIRYVFEKAVEVQKPWSRVNDAEEERSDRFVNTEEKDYAEWKEWWTATFFNSEDSKEKKRDAEFLLDDPTTGTVEEITESQYSIKIEGGEIITVDKEAVTAVHRDIATIEKETKVTVAPSALSSPSGERKGKLLQGTVKQLPNDDQPRYGIKFEGTDSVQFIDKDFVKLAGNRSGVIEAGANVEVRIGASPSRTLTDYGEAVVKDMVQGNLNMELRIEVAERILTKTVEMNEVKEKKKRLKQCSFKFKRAMTVCFKEELTKVILDLYEGSEEYKQRLLKYLNIKAEAEAVSKAETKPDDAPGAKTEAKEKKLYIEIQNKIDDLRQTERNDETVMHKMLKLDEETSSSKSPADESPAVGTMVAEEDGAEGKEADDAAAAISPGAAEEKDVAGRGADDAAAPKALGTAEATAADGVPMARAEVAAEGKPETGAQSEYSERRAKVWQKIDNTFKIKLTEMIKVDLGVEDFSIDEEELQKLKEGVEPGVRISLTKQWKEFAYFDQLANRYCKDWLVNGSKNQRLSKPELRVSPDPNVEKKSMPWLHAAFSHCDHKLSLLDDHDKDIPINGSLKKQTHLPAAELVEKLDGLPLIGGRDALFSSFTEEDYKNTRIDKKIVDTWKAKYEEVNLACMWGGYRDILLNVQHEGTGFVGELQLSLDDLAKKKKDAHGVSSAKNTFHSPCLTLWQRSVSRS